MPLHWRVVTLKIPEGKGLIFGYEQPNWFDFGFVLDKEELLICSAFIGFFFLMARVNIMISKPSSRLE